MKKLMQKIEIVVAAFGLHSAVFFVAVPAHAIMNEEGGKAMTEREFSAVGFLADKAETVAMAETNSNGAATENAAMNCTAENGNACNEAIEKERSTVSELK